MIILSLASNLTSIYGDRFETLKFAISFLESYGINIIKKSSFYETESIPDKKNPKFINMIISVKTDLPPVDLMSVLIHIEKKLGRIRNKKNDPRTCDIDIIDYKGEVLSFSYQDYDLTVPHKSLTSRNFVLIPLSEIEPNWRHPKTNETVSALIDKIGEENRKSILKI